MGGKPKVAVQVFHNRHHRVAAHAFLHGITAEGGAGKTEKSAAVGGQPKHAFAVYQQIAYIGIGHPLCFCKRLHGTTIVTEKSEPRTHPDLARNTCSQRRDGAYFESGRRLRLHLLRGNPHNAPSFGGNGKCGLTLCARPFHGIKKAFIGSGGPVNNLHSGLRGSNRECRIFGYYHDTPVGNPEYLLDVGAPGILQTVRCTENTPAPKQDAAVGAYPPARAVVKQGVNHSTRIFSGKVHRMRPRRHHQGYPPDTAGHQGITGRKNTVHLVIGKPFLLVEIAERPPVETAEASKRSDPDKTLRILMQTTQLTMRKTLARSVRKKGVLLGTCCDQSRQKQPYDSGRSQPRHPVLHSGLR